MPQPPIASMRKLTGAQIDAPGIDAIAGELERLAHATPGSSITLCFGCRSMRIKFVPGCGYQVLTYREDFSIESMFVAPTQATTIEPDDDGSRYPVVTSSCILESVSSLSQAG